MIHGAVVSLCSLAWGQTIVEVMAVMATSLTRTYQECCVQFPWPHSRPLSTHASTGDYWTLTGISGSVSCGPLVLSPGSGCTQGSVCALQESASPVLWKFCNQIPLVFKVKSLVVLNPFTDPQVGKFVLGSRTLTTVGELLWYNCCCS